ncbi:MAG: hypothetical protein WB622_14700 [Acidobacteriaceae bacterium]
MNKLPQCELPSLWKPRRDHFIHVDALPMLGTRKIDLRAVRQIALNQAQLVEVRV